jgi:hypothetical protein
VSDPGHGFERRAAVAVAGLAAVALLTGCTGSEAAHPTDATPQPRPTPVQPHDKGDVYHRGKGDTAHTNPVGTGNPRP